MLRDTDSIRSALVCLRSRLDLSVALVLAHEHLSYSSVSERIDLIQSFFTDNLKEIDTMMVRYGLTEWWDRGLNGIRDIISPCHSDPAAAEIAFQHIVFYSSMNLKANNFMRKFLNVCSSLRFFITADGHIGMGPFAMQEKDVVVVLFGGPVPYILRPKGGHYELVGECYVHGIMEGKAIYDLKEKGELERRTKVFRLR
jgi:hypothetical protein